MTFKKVLLPAVIALFALWRTAAAATLKSSDDSFSLSVPGRWQISGSTDPGCVLQAKKGQAVIKIRSLPVAAAEESVAQTF